MLKALCNVEIIMKKNCRPAIFSALAYYMQNSSPQRQAGLWLILYNFIECVIYRICPFPRINHFSVTSFSNANGPLACSF